MSLCPSSSSRKTVSSREYNYAIYGAADLWRLLALLDILDGKSLQQLSPTEFVRKRLAL